MSGFDCLVDGTHEYSFKARKGAVCSLCGVYYLPGCPAGYKSERYSSKVHFNANEFEQMLAEQDLHTRITWAGYLELRGKMVRFILDKGRLLKMSLKILHLAVHVMDLYCEKARPKLTFGKDEVIAASALLIAAKSGELDERVPFITKLKKYADLDQDVLEFKKTEVAIAQVLDWNLQKLPYYSYVEHYLASGVISPQDRVSKKVLDTVTREGLEDTVRLLARGESTRNNLSSVLNSLSQSTQQVSEPAIHGGLSSRSKDSSEDTYTVSMGVLSQGIRSELIKVFELYTRDLSNLVLRDFPHWAYKKNNVALAILMYARAAIFDPSQAFNTRLQELSVLPASELRETITRLSNFIRSGEVNLHSPDSEMLPSTAGTPGYTQQYKSSHTASSGTGSDAQASGWETSAAQIFRVSLQPTQTLTPVNTAPGAGAFYRGPISGTGSTLVSGSGYSTLLKPLSEQISNLGPVNTNVTRDAKQTKYRSSNSITSGNKYSSRGNSTERSVYHPLTYHQPVAASTSLNTAGPLSHRRHAPASALLKENK